MNNLKGCTIDHFDLANDDQSTIDELFIFLNHYRLNKLACVSIELLNKWVNHLPTYISIKLCNHDLNFINDHYDVFKTFKLENAVILNDELIEKLINDNILDPISAILYQNITGDKLNEILKKIE